TDAVDRTGRHPRDVRHVGTRLGHHIGRGLASPRPAQRRLVGSAAAAGPNPSTARRRPQAPGAATTTPARIPFAQWPGTWHPRRSDATSVGASGTVQAMSTRWLDVTTTRMPATAGATLTSGVGPGGGFAAAAS